MELGDKIRELRISKRWTLGKLGANIGLSIQAISQYERGKRQPSISILAKISDALGVELSELINESKKILPNDIYNQTNCNSEDTAIRHLKALIYYVSGYNNLPSEINNIILQEVCNTIKYELYKFKSDNEL